MAFFALSIIVGILLSIAVTDGSPDPAVESRPGVYPVQAGGVEGSRMELASEPSLSPEPTLEASGRWPIGVLEVRLGGQLLEPVEQHVVVASSLPGRSMGESVAFSHVGYAEVQLPLGKAYRVDVRMRGGQQAVASKVIQLSREREEWLVHIRGFGSASFRVDRSDLVGSGPLRAVLFRPAPIDESELGIGRWAGLDVSIRVSGREYGVRPAESDHSGRFIVPGIPAGQYSLQAVDPSDESRFGSRKSKVFEVLPGEATDLGVIEIEEWSLGLDLQYVDAASREPIAGVETRAGPGAPNSFFQVQTEGRSSGHGLVALDASCMDWFLESRHPSYATDWRSFAFLLQGSLNVVELFPVSEVLVVGAGPFLPSQGRELFLTANDRVTVGPIANEEGLLFLDVPPGDVNLIQTTFGIVDFSMPLAIRPGERNVVDLGVGATGEVRGTVSTGGMPLKTGMVQILGHTVAGKRVAVGRVVEGAFRVPIVGLAPSELRVCSAGMFHDADGFLSLPVPGRVEPGTEWHLEIPGSGLLISAGPAGMIPAQPILVSRMPIAAQWAGMNGRMKFQIPFPDDSAVEVPGLIPGPYRIEWRDVAGGERHLEILVPDEAGLVPVELGSR